MSITEIVTREIVTSKEGEQLVNDKALLHHCSVEQDAWSFEISLKSKPSDIPDAMVD